MKEAILVLITFAVLAYFIWIDKLKDKTRKPGKGGYGPGKENNDKRRDEDWNLPE